MTRGPFLLVLAAALVAVTALVGSLVVSGGEARAQSSVPAAPTGLTASAVSHDAVSLAWDDAADAAITGYQVLRRSRDGDAYGDGRGAWEFVAVVADTASSATSYTDTTVTARTRYVYRVKAINPAGLGARSSYLNVETSDAPAAQTAPAAPTGLSASSVSYDAVSLAWDDAGDTTISGYQVLRRSRDGDIYRDGRGAWEFVAIVADTASPATSYTDTTVTARTRYVYRVKAINPAGLGARSSYLNVETPDAPAAQTAPAAPTGLNASAVSHDAVSLAWDDAGDTTISGYEVLRRSRDGDTYRDGRGAAEFVAVVADTTSSATSYTDTTVTAHTRYVYRVKAINPAGASPRSSYLNIETPPAPENPEPEPETTETGTETTTTTEPPEPVATAVLVTEPPEDEPQTAQQQTSADQTLTTTIWTATMTVGVTDTTAANGFRNVERGYASSALRESPYGGLDDDTFDYNGHTYTVDRLATARTTAPSNTVIQDNFRLTAGESGDPHLGADLVLYVGDQPFRLDAIDGTSDTSGLRTYRWAAPPVLVDGETVAVRLVEELPPVPAPETIWSTTMTTGAVERTPSVVQRDRETGYTRLGDPSGHLGSLDGDTFDYDGDTYTVHQIRRAEATTFRSARHDGIARNELSFRVTVDDHGNDFSDLALIIGHYAPIPFADATSSVTNFGSDRVRTFVFSDHIPWFGGDQSVAVRIDRLDREFRGPDGYPVSARLAVGDDWVDQTYPNVCGGLDRFTCRLPDADSQWFVVRLKDNRRYVVEVDTEANNHRPRLRHIAPSWNTDRRLSFTDQFDNAVPIRNADGSEGITHTGGTDMLYLDTNADSLRGGDYLVRVRHNGYSVKDPDYRIRIREQ